MPASASILIILMGSLGDLVRGFCLVPHIKANFPHSRLTWLVEPKWAELVRFHKHIDKVIVFDRAWRLSALWKLYRDLSAEHFDITLDLQRILKSGFFSLLSGARRRLGFHRRNAKEFNWIFNNEHIGYYSDDLAKIQHYLKFTAHLGLPPPSALDFGLSPLNDNDLPPWMVAVLDRPFIAVVLGASWRSKDWSFQGYLQLVRDIIDNLGMRTVLLGDGSRTEMARDLCRRINQPGVIDAAGQTTLVQLAAVLKKAAAAVGPDSGPGHLAAAVGTPFVTLFGPTSPKRTAPFGYEDLVVTPVPRCAPCYKKRCPDRPDSCMFDISSSHVMEKLAEALAISRCER